LKGFRGGHDTSLPEARSRRRDDGSGQAALRRVASDHAHRRLADLSSSNPSGGGRAPTPDRSKAPAKGFPQVEKRDWQTKAPYRRPKRAMVSACERIAPPARWRNTIRYCALRLIQNSIKSRATSTLPENRSLTVSAKRWYSSFGSMVLGRCVSTTALTPACAAMAPTCSGARCSSTT
jgi:hypothetical protein